MIQRLLTLVVLFWGSSLFGPVYAGPDSGNLDLTGASCCVTLSMTDTQGAPRHLTEFAGKVVIVSFGFTHCPDVCPTTLSELAQSVEVLEKEGKDVQVLFVTLDPIRDTSALLSRYVTAFHPSFIALRGSPEETKEVTLDFRVLYREVPDQKSKGYSIEHSVGVYLFDKTGKARVYARSADPKTLLPEIKRLLAMRSL